MVRLTRIKKGTNNSANVKKRGILRLLSAPARYVKRKIVSAYKKLVKKEQKKPAKVVYNEETMKRKSIDELKGIAKLKGIKNRGKLKKEGLITSLLRSEISNAERNYNTNVSNNTANDDTYDCKISDIRAILSRLGNIVTKNDREEVKKELYEIENKKNLSDKEKKKIDDNLLELVNKLSKKEKYRYYDRDDLDYHGIRDIENLFDNVNDNDYYKPILVKSSFKNNYKYYESRGDKDKKLSVKQYLYKIMPYLSDLINENKAIENNSNE